MFKKFSISAVALAAVGFAGAASAQTLTNPWAGDGGEVDVEIVVGQIGEVFSSVGTGQDRNNDPALPLEITNAGGNIPPSGIAIDTLFHFANVDYDVLVDINGDIPEFSRFHILAGIQNRGSYDAVAGGGTAGATQAVADNVVTYDRRAASTGYIGNQPGTPITLLSGTAANSLQTTLVDYAADAIHGLPAVTAGTATEVIYTIAAQ